MLTSYYIKLPHGCVAHSLTSPSNKSETQFPDSRYLLRPMLVQFHRLATLLLVTFMGLLAVMGLVMRIVYPQPLLHSDDLSGYEAFLPGKIVNPEDFGFRLLPHSSFPEETYLDNPQRNSYINSTVLPLVIIIDIPYQQKQIVRFTAYSDTLHFLDLLWRWGRPDQKEKDIPNRHWDIGWHKDRLTISVFVHTLNLNTTVTRVRIDLN